ncbi:AzlD domain-containing protein [Nocardia donostiensis]|uniref:Branched-chain amino acid transporter n=1 Tax=Nocardia donostiensis TaxID=1538463 RepID=A0A1W0B868_9NOCA|nr:AzlD domain-containing protein [Nocardia donostiensis]ONM46324.1 branched-chain amino acid transporter [Nocardia donostiensis]OQS16642.1 branched-chain amino acid transporter [Nocardia donostiensis]OQS18641.1 branched-chain amino acid transporter [Nocardia donostiensis]
MSAPLLIPAMLALAAGTYALRWSGPALRNRIRFPPRAVQLLEVAAVILLAALVATSTLPLGTGEVGIALPAGVLVGGLLAWFRCPLLLVVVAAAATTALLRAIGLS